MRLYRLSGRPKPKVVWFLENTIIDDSYEIRSDGITVNHLTFPKVGRQHLQARLSCQASNNNLVLPETRTAILDINCKYKTTFRIGQRCSMMAINQNSAQKRAYIKDAERLQKGPCEDGNSSDGRFFDGTLSQQKEICVLAPAEKAIEIFIRS